MAYSHLRSCSRYTAQLASFQSSSPSLKPPSSPLVPLTAFSYLLISFISAHFMADSVYIHWRYRLLYETHFPSYFSFSSSLHVSHPLVPFYSSYIIFLFVFCLTQTRDTIQYLTFWVWFISINIFSRWVHCLTDILHLPFFMHYIKIINFSLMLSDTMASVAETLGVMLLPQLHRERPF